MRKYRFSPYLKAVCTEYGFTEEELFQKTKRPDLVEARRTLIYLCHQHCQEEGISNSYIVEFFKRYNFDMYDSLILHHVSRYKELNEKKRSKDISKDVLSRANISAS
jgi:hypothetical protein